MPTKLNQDQIDGLSDDLNSLDSVDDSLEVKISTEDSINDQVDVTLSSSILEKQDKLVSGTNIKTINGNSLLGSGDLNVTSSSAWGFISGNLSGQTDLQNVLNQKQNTLTSGTNIKTINSNSLLGSGNIALTKSDVGLGNVDNTSDANKPVSTATQTALGTKPTNKLSVGTNVTGTTAVTISASSLLPSNTLVVGNPCMIHLKARGRRVAGTLGVITVGMYRNTSVSLAGATFIGQIQMTTTNTFGQFERHLFWDGSGNVSVITPATLATDIVNNGTYSTTTINPSVNNYFLYTVQCANSGDTGQIQWGLQIIYI